ncbi:T9SS type A sorting domain-containing protein [Puia dinghuensis]|uniref:T9SS C-terminal target domain-containing protein n=1 Tax=Puia dinghuensis TaxID=1792502 RepID=A0A8J2UAG3_9BACT|nr:T9SS type A sorting domain-containing protein [Puia dinghuensis]GGA90388.1 hypothetical protein GCM10011511_12010 [Puia dinghuensis]
MKTTFTLTMWTFLLVAGCLLILSSLLPAPVTAQSAVTAQFTHWTNATTSTSYSGTGATGNYGSGLTGNTYNYDFGTAVGTPNFNILDSFTAATLNYHFTYPTTVKFRRVNNATVTGLRKSLWFEQSSGTTVNPGGTVSLLPAYDDSLESIFSQGQIFNVGIDNNFQNQGNGSGTNNNNIERVDHIITSGVIASDNTKAGFVVFDRGNGGGHDPFYVAAIASLDASGNPLTYYNAVSVASGSYGFDVSPLMNYIILRKNQFGPVDAHLLMMNNSTSQYRDGVFMNFQALGVPNGTKIYGYSLFPADLGSTAAANLVNYNNAANFPTNSNFAAGGIDQVAVSGLWVTNASYVVLPDRVNSFAANPADGKVELDWALGAVDDIGKLVVERSADGEHFTPLMEFAAPLTSQQTAVDVQPLPGEDYYRLKLVDLRGMEAAYSTVSRVVLGVAAGVSLSVYPNPVTGKRISYTVQGLQPGTYGLRVVDMSGHLVAGQSLSGGSVVAGSLALPAGLPAGVYSLQLVDKRGNGVIATSVECN